MARHQISLTVNGRRHQAAVSPRVSLADFLRDQLGYTGTHLGCEHGVCGCCNVLLNGEVVRSCLLFAVQADGAEVLTIEGLAQSGEPHPIQRAMLEQQGFQCGYCTPGVVMSLYELFQHYPEPTDDEVAAYLGSCLCRCTGYAGIKRAVEALRSGRQGVEAWP